MKKWKKTIGIGLFGAALFGGSLWGLTKAAQAEEASFLTWKNGKENQVSVVLNGAHRSELYDAAAFQMEFFLDGDGVVDASFTFDPRLDENEELAKGYRYDEDRQSVTVYVAGRTPIFGTGALELGTLTVDSKTNVDIYADPDSCKVVDFYHTEMAVEDLDELEPYEMILEADEPETKPDEPETKPDEPETKPDEPETKPDKPATRPNRGIIEDEDEVWTDYTNSMIAPPASVMTGEWKRRGDSWSFKRSDGAYAKNEWGQIGGYWYWFDKDGKMKTGWIQLAGSWYFCKETGEMKTGWVQDNGAWYYLGGDGKLLSSAVTPDGYAVDASGAWTGANGQSRQ